MGGMWFGPGMAMEQFAVCPGYPAHGAVQKARDCHADPSEEGAIEALHLPVIVACAYGVHGPDFYFSKSSHMTEKVMIPCVQPMRDRGKFFARNVSVRWWGGAG